MVGRAASLQGIIWRAINRIFRQAVERAKRRCREVFRKTFRMLLRSLAVLIGLLVIVLLFQPRVQALFRSRDHFIRYGTEAGVFYEPGAERYTELAAASLPLITADIEEARHAPFRKPFFVYVCNTQESFNRLIGDPQGFEARGATFRGNVYLSPKAFFFEGQDTHRETIAHELAHMHMYQAIGPWRTIRRVPVWFQEGLAHIMADTGGERVGDREAITAILKGDTFTPDDKGSFLIPKRAPDYGLPWPMFHKQTRMFVTYLRDGDAAAFDRFLADLYAGGLFAAAFSHHFGGSVPDVWARFLAELAVSPHVD